ncbi:hypothetical protein BMS3Bbin05_02280 [bacterium BMS3Bbin05]|nr:hypothetical protein BMS3Bbin05_02280 [bacterium BMS3Bbin05]
MTFQPIPGGDALLSGDCFRCGSRPDTRIDSGKKRMVANKARTARIAAAKKGVEKSLT